VRRGKANEVWRRRVGHLGNALYFRGLQPVFPAGFSSAP